MMFPGQNWCAVKDGDPTSRSIFNRHYSRHFFADNRNPKLFMGPGEKRAYRTADGLAIFGWRKFISDNGQEGVNCAYFRNEGPILSSLLILEAEQLAWQIWYGERLYTYVDPKKVKSSNPGYCFLMAGWRKCGVTKSNHLIILEKLPKESHA
jgi:hypothetical protein